MAVPINQPIGISEWDSHSYQALEPGVRDGDYVSSDSCLVAAGPPTLQMTGGIPGNLDLTKSPRDSNNIQLSDNTAYPIGIAQGINIGQNLQQMRIYEVGSNFDYVVTGRSVGQVTLSKVFISSASLLRVLYAYYQTSAVKVIESLFDTPYAAANVLNDVYISPGSNNIFMNLASDLFRNPMGLLFIMRTSQNNDIGGFYLERAVVHAHNIAFDPQGIIIQENATLSFSRIVPVAIQASNILNAVSKFADYFDITSVS